MKHPLTLSYPVGQAPALAWVMVSCLVFSLVVVTWWGIALLNNPGGSVWRLWVLALTWLVSAVGIGWQLRRDSKGWLRFDGERWWYHPLAPTGHSFSEQAVVLRVCWDAQQFMLLHTTWADVPAGYRVAGRYIWARQAVLPALWLDWRRAVLFMRRHPIARADITLSPTASKALHLD
jgi:hypothetical protein